MNAVPYEQTAMAAEMRKMIGEQWPELAHYDGTLLERLERKMAVEALAEEAEDEATMRACLSVACGRQLEEMN